MRKRVSHELHIRCATHPLLRPSGRSVFQPPPSLFLSFCGAASSPQPIPKHTYPPTFRGRQHGHAPQIIQQRKFLRFAQDARSGAALQVRCETARVLRAMAADTRIRNMACETGRHCHAYAEKRKGRERVMRRRRFASFD